MNWNEMAKSERNKGGGEDEQGGKSLTRREKPHNFIEQSNL